MANIDKKAPSSLVEFQKAYGEYLRSPKEKRLPLGVPVRRSEIYENLLFNNLSGFVSNCFPVACSLFSELQWSEWTRRFFRDWRCDTPIFAQIPYEFVDFFAHEYTSLKAPAWLPELLHYEWMELEVDLDEAGELTMQNVQSNLLGGIISNPTLRCLAYEWPVHMIGQDFQPEYPEACFLAVYRNSDLDVRFTQLNATTYSLLSYIQQNSGTVDQILPAFAELIQHPNPEQVIEFGRSLLADFVVQQILLESGRE